MTIGIYCILLILAFMRCCLSFYSLVDTNVIEKGDTL